MNSAEKLVKNDPKFYDRKLPQLGDWGNSFKQIVRHTRNISTNELSETRRPNESDEVKDYRIKNKRRFTKSVITELYSKFSKILTESGVGEGSMSDILKNWLETNPFTYQGIKTDLWNYWYRNVIPSGMEDANSAMLMFPYNSKNKDVAPSALAADGGLMANERVSILPMLIPHYDIVVMPDAYLQVFAWKGGHISIRIKDKDVLKPFFFVVDEEWYYRYIPTSTLDANKQVVYVLEKWYQHNTGRQSGDIVSKELPVSFMSGVLTTSENGDYKYHESFLQGACERFDEFDVRFQDNQIVNARFAHPIKMVNGDISCKKCKGTGQEQYTKTIDGIPQLKTRNCASCGGSRRSQDSPSGTVTDNRKGLDGKSNRPLIELLTGDTNFLKLNKDDAFSFLKMGANSLGVDVLIDLNESGEAMKVRMKPSAYFLENITNGFFGDLMVKQLYFAECLLQTNIALRLAPTITLPKSYEIHTVDELTAKVKETYGADRFNAIMEVLNQKYKDNPAKLRAEELKICYSPLWILDEKDEEGRQLLSVYGKEEYIKRDYSSIALNKLLKDPQKDIMNMSDEQVFEYIDDFVKPFLPIAPTVLFDGEEQIGGVNQQED